MSAPPPEPTDPSRPPDASEPAWGPGAEHEPAADSPSSGAPPAPSPPTTPPAPGTEGPSAAPFGPSPAPAPAGPPPAEAHPPPPRPSGAAQPVPGLEPSLPQGQTPPAHGDGAPIPSHPGTGAPERSADRAERVGEPAWAAWQGLLGLFAWVVATFVVGSIVIVAASALGLASLDSDRTSPGILIAATVAGDLVFVGVPIAFAAITARPRLWHFGLRRTRFWPTLGWAALALVGWFAFSAIYQAVVDPKGSQSTADDLGINRSTALLVLGGFVVIVLAPIVEEFFFRGFIYRTLRNGLVGRMGLGAGVALAAVLDGLLFGFVHATNTPLGILPVLAVLGAAFCLVYERTGSLFAVIALHAVVNMLGYLGAAKNSVPVALGFGVAMIVACVVIPRMLGRGRPRAEAPAPA